MLGATFAMSLSSFPESPGSRPPPYLLPIPPLLLQPLSPLLLQPISPPLLQPSTTAARSCVLSCHLLLSLTRLVSGPNRLSLEDALGVLTKAGLHHAIGLLYMARDMVREALSVWRDLGTGVKVDACSDGLISTLNFLSTCEDMVRLAALCPCVYLPYSLLTENSSQCHIVEGFVCFSCALFSPFTKALDSPCTCVCCPSGCVLVVCWLCAGCVLVVCWLCAGCVLVVCSQQALIEEFAPWVLLRHSDKGIEILTSGAPPLAFSPTADVARTW
jgi:hypothetical protein